jgi:putative CocE/NonD family hydrolase
VSAGPDAPAAARVPARPARPVRVIDPAWIPLADGSRLCARIWLPESAAELPVPAILEYLPYRKDDVTAVEDSTIHPYFAARGYASVRVDIRGSGDSDGVLTDEYSELEHRDALEVIAWLAAQPWCTGAVGMMGISWSGFNSLQVAALRPPALKAIITACSTDDRYDNDVHYYGGVPLGYYLLPWASAMMAFNVRPPDPAIVGERWRDLWLERLAGNVDLARLWVGHQRRDGYWRHGSICEDYDAIRCPVLMVGGWADAYVDAIFRMLAGLSCPRRALIGPWGHQWPQAGRPGPRIGFLQEAVGWWDHWLKGEPNGAMDEPLLRAWMPEAVPPATDYEERPGRWIAEDAWPPSPSRRARRARWELDATGLREPGAGGAGGAVGAGLTHGSGQTVGLDAGAWCAYGAPADLPGDQRRDDALSLHLDTEPLTERLEIFGAPALTLSLRSDRPTAFAMARLGDVAPDGRCTLITRGALNLCHAAGHAEPQPLTPHAETAVSIALKSVAYAIPAGHRLRLAISTSYWPWLWPSPEPVTLTIATGGASALTVPIRAPSPRDADLAPFGPPETAPPLPVERLRPPSPTQTITTDPATGTVTYAMARGFSGAQRFASGLEYHDHDPITFTITDGDPLSARVRCERRVDILRGDWRTRVELRSQMTADAADFHLQTTIDAYEGEQRIHTRTFTAVVPRDHA